MVLSHRRVPIVATPRGVVVIVIVPLVAVRWLSTEVEPAREPLGSRSAATTETAPSEAASRPAKATAIHHTKENFWVDAAMHSAAAATTAEHVRWIDQVLAAVVTSTFPTYG